MDSHFASGDCRHRWISGRYIDSRGHTEHFCKSVRLISVFVVMERMIADDPMLDEGEIAQIDPSAGVGKRRAVEGTPPASTATQRSSPGSSPMSTTIVHERTFETARSGVPVMEDQWRQESTELRNRLAVLQQQQTGSQEAIKLLSGECQSTVLKAIDMLQTVSTGMKELHQRQTAMQDSGTMVRSALEQTKGEIANATLGVRNFTQPFMADLMQTKEDVRNALMGNALIAVGVESRLSEVEKVKE